MPIPDSKLNELFAPLEGGDPSWTRTLKPHKQETADKAMALVVKMAPAWNIDLTQFDTDIVDLVDLDLPALGPWICFQSKANGKARGYDAFWTCRNPMVTVVDMGSPFTWG